MRYLSLLVLLFLASYASAQKNVIDKIIAVVGEEIVLKSMLRIQFYMNIQRISKFFRRLSYQNIRKFIGPETVSGSS